MLLLTLMRYEKSENNIESDSFDRELYGNLRAESEELTDLIRRGSNLLPGFEALVSDLFYSFYKHNVLFLESRDIRRKSVIGRNILERVFADNEYEKLREETVLDGFKAAVASVDMGNQIYNWLRSDDGPGERSLIKEWETDKAESDYDEIKEEMDTWDEVEEQQGGEENEAFQKAKEDKQAEFDEEQANFTKLSEEQDEKHQDIDAKLGNMVKQSMEQTGDTVDNVDDELTSWGSSMGSPGEKGIGEKIDLAAKLYKNEKLRKLSYLVGGLKQEMLSARRKSWSKRGSEVFDITTGNELGHIIPSELSTLINKTLSLDFKKKFVEERLLQYNLKEEKGRGPMVVCLDGSSSMDGKKELWSKGVCLTLLEIAKRERRKFIVIVFSSGGVGLRVFESDGGKGWGMKEKDVFELADYFPGGGTNFEEPLNKSLEYLNESKFSGGDIVFITDGEANVGDGWLEEFKSTQSKLKFKVYSVLIDVTGRESVVSLTRFSDKITTVSKLTSKDARGLFVDL